MIFIAQLHVHQSYPQALSVGNLTLFKFCFLLRQFNEYRLFLVFIRETNLMQVYENVDVNALYILISTNM